MEYIISNCTLLNALQPGQKQKLAGVMKSHVFNSTEVVFVEGTEGSCLYVVDTGTFIVSKATQRSKSHVFTYSTGGSVFGQLSVIFNTPRGMTLTAGGKAGVVNKCWEIDKEAFRAVLTEGNSNPKKMLEDIAVVLSS